MKLAAYCNMFLHFLMDSFRQKGLLWEMTKKDLKMRYLGSHLGIMWAFIQPTITVLIFWFVFQVGFKSMPVNNFPFILWLMAGMIPWFFISDGIQSATTSILESSHLVKKVVFRVSLLPLIKIVSALLIHVFFIGVLFVMFSIYGYSLSLYNMQVFYYAFAAFCFMLGISWLSATLTIFLKDVGQLIAMILQFGFWLTPIFWSLPMIPVEYARFFRYNPVYYITEGYRNSFIYGKWFWEDMNGTLYYWGITILLLFIGAVVFKKMRPHFADVL